MDTSGTDPLIFLHPLADRQGRFSALMLVADGSVDESPASLVEHPDFLGLVSQFPCLFDNVALEQSRPTLANALALAGCRPISPDCVVRADQQFSDQYPTTIEWVDGAWYLSPPSKPIGNQAASRALALQLVQLVASDAESREIEAIFRRDPTLSYQLLRLVNSLAIGAGRHITSFSQAIIMLGRRQLRRWLNLMVFSAREGDKRSMMLLAKVAVRARAMELLARASGLDFSLQDQAFMIGMFSLMGALFGMPAEEVLRPLAISDAMRSSLITRDGELGNLLHMMELGEQGDFTELRGRLEAIQVSTLEFNLANAQACNWMLGVISDSRGDNHA